MSDQKNNDIYADCSQQPLLFISHKHCDSAIADSVSNFVRNISGGSVEVYQSSNPYFESPRIGKELTQELEDALWRAGIVVLIYTSQDQDWSWCMWECGVALEPNSPDTKIVVIQCLKDEPQVFKGGVHVHAWDEDSVINFAKRFGESDFFPNWGKPVTWLNERELESSAKALYKDLRDAIPQKQRENWNAWPYVKIKIPRCALEPLKNTERDKRLELAKEIIRQEATIVDTGSGFPQLFRLHQISCNTPFRDLINIWLEHYPDSHPYWLDVITQQVINGALKQTPDVPEWHRFRHAKSNEESIPIIGRIKGDYSDLKYDIYFYGVATIPLVNTRMNSLHHMYYVDLSRQPSHERNLMEILNNLELRDWSRLPVLENSIPRCVIHVSIIDRYLRRKAAEGESIDDLTLADLLADSTVENSLKDAWSTVSELATISDAYKIMNSHRKCRNLFITKNGVPEEPVLGWLTDHDIRFHYQ